MKRVFVLLLCLAGCAPAIQPDIRGSLGRAVLDRSPQPILLAEVPARGVAATLAPAAAGGRDGVVLWRTGQDQTLALRDGVLVATRGLGDDLMSADVAGTLAALHGGPQSGYPRLMTFLDGNDGTLFRAMVCAMAPPVPAVVRGIDLDFATTLRVETCHTTGLTVENRYWQDADGDMRRSEQWIGPGLGVLSTEILTR